MGQVDLKWQGEGGEWDQTHISAGEREQEKWGWTEAQWEGSGVRPKWWGEVSGEQGWTKAVGGGGASPKWQGGGEWSGVRAEAGGWT